MPSFRYTGKARKSLVIKGTPAALVAQTDVAMVVTGETRHSPRAGRW